jgi:hypothetical protein
LIEEYENWEDSIRRTFIELANYMEQNSNPIEYLIEFAWANGADRFVVNNAKDELKKLKENSKEWAAEVYRANEFAVEQTNEYLEISKQMQELKDSLEKPVAWARINDRGDLFDPRLCNNIYVDQNTVVPLYRKNK